MNPNRRRAATRGRVHDAKSRVPIAPTTQVAAIQPSAASQFGVGDDSVHLTQQHGHDRDSAARHDVALLRLADALAARAQESLVAHDELVPRDRGAAFQTHVQSDRDRWREQET